LASGTLAPDGSTTVPFTTAVGACASNVVLETRHTKIRERTAIRGRFISQPPVGTLEIVTFTAIYTGFNANGIWAHQARIAK